MIMKLILGGLFGLILGMVTDWFAFDSIGGGIGIGIALAIGISIALVALETEKNR